MTGQLLQLADQWDEGLPGSPEETCAMRACAAQLREALRAQAEAEQDTPESVKEAVKAANSTRGRSRPLPKEEDEARFDVLQTGMTYGSALRAAAELPEARTAFRAAQARLAAALAQADAGGEA